MTHADTLRAWAAQYITPAAREPFLSGADALDTLERVREVVERIECALARNENNSDHDRGVALAYGITLYFITEALEGDTE